MVRGRKKGELIKKKEVVYFPLEIFKPLHLLMASGRIFSRGENRVGCDKKCPLNKTTFS